tara:strand:+ start:296 stop:550 length:255 start_codon:yes stop_codon:yes gene_type:complete
MKNLEIRSTNLLSKENIYKKNLKEAIVFLRHPEDKIKVSNDEQVELQIYDNGEPIFIGSKNELFEILKDANRLPKLRNYNNPMK